MSTYNTNNESKTSFFAKLSASFLSHIRNMATGSAILRIFAKFGLFISRLLLSSGIISFLARPEQTTTLFNNSVCGRIISWLPNALTRVLKRFGVFFSRRFPATLTLWGLQWIGARFDVFFALFITFHALTPSSYYRNPYTVAALAFLVVSASVRVAFVRAPSASFSLKRVDPIYILYILAMAVSGTASMFGAGGGEDSLTTSVLYLTSIAFAALIANTHNDKPRLMALITVITGVSFIMALYGVYQYLVGIPINAAQTDESTGGASLAMGRADATMGNPNVLAAWLLLAIPFAVTLFFTAKSVIRKLLAAGVTLVMTVCLLLTQSRSAWVGVFVAAVVYLFLLNWRLIPIFGSIGVLSIPFWPSFILDRLLTAGTDSSSLYRLKIYGGAFRMALTNWATGVGIGVDYFKRYINNFTYFAYETSPVHSHNLLLQIWMESGIVAVFTFIWLLFRLIKKGGVFIFEQKAKTREASLLRHLSKSRQFSGFSRTTKSQASRHDLQMVTTACISAVIGFVVMGFFEYAWFYPRCMNHFFMIIGIFFCATNLTRNQKLSS